MKFDPINEVLYTDNGELIKKMNCPYRIDWDDLPASTSSPNRNCSMCERQIIDTENRTDEEILNLMKKNPSTCLKVDIDQDNIRITLDNNF